MNQWRKLVLLVTVCAVVQLVSAYPLVCLQPNSVQCIQGVIKATAFNLNYEAFLGIPFAKPPIGALRFANPVPNDPWTGTHDATQPKLVCIRKNEYQPQEGVVGSEDCLYLNVYKPQVEATNLPVLIYIHGVEFLSGSADHTIRGPDRFMNGQDAIMVSISYRLGALGFLSTGDSVAPGNFGLKDQSMAIRWVRKYISLFGGDSQKITVFGEGAGAAATQYHMMSPLSRGNFSRAIMMSGSALALSTPNPIRIARLQAQVLGNILSATLTSSQLISYLRNVPAVDLVNSFDAVQQLLGFANSVTVYRPVIEQFVPGQSYLHESPLTMWAAGNYEQIPWMAGHVPNEGIAFAPFLRALAASPSMWASIIAQGPSALTQALHLESSAIPALLQRFYGSLSLPPSPSEVTNLTYNLASELYFAYPLMKSITQHLQHANRLTAPVSVYFMTFEGQYTVAPLFLPGSTLSVVFTDDLQYVVTRPALFPDFTFPSGGSLMVSKMGKLFVEFALTGHALPSYLGTCPSTTSCKQIELNSASLQYDPIEVLLTDAIDLDVLNFWDGLYNSSSSPVMASLLALAGRRD